MHRGHTDLQDCVTQLDTTQGMRAISSTRPKELLVAIQLPLCKTSENVNLDIFEKSLLLESNNPNYRLSLDLPYPINEAESRAKFDKSKRCLNLTLQVVPYVAHVEVISNSTSHLVESVTEEREAEDNSSFLPSSASSSSCNSLSSVDANIPATVLPVLGKLGLIYQTLGLFYAKFRIIIMT